MRRSAAPSVRAIKKAKLQHSSLDNSSGKDRFQASEHETASSSRVCNNTLLSNSSPGDGTEDTKRPRPLCSNTLSVRRPVLFKPPLLNKAQTSHDSKENNTGQASAQENTCSYYYSVVWGKLSKKKHKKWDGDGILVTRGRTAVLKDLEGKEISKSAGYKTAELEGLQEGQTLCIGGKEMEIMGHVSSKDYLSGSCFHQVLVSSTPNGHLSLQPKQSKGVLKPFSVPNKDKASVSSSPDTASLATITPRHNVNAPDALVFPRPNPLHQREHNNTGLMVVDVVMDPHIGRHLRPHQREGIIFLYECVMGMRSFHGNGAILADDMGLGKTVQCIALVWTLHKQGMYGGQAVVKRTLVITPGSLVKNWCAEFRKWLGSERMKVYAVNSEKRVEEFKRSPVYPVMVVSYEMLLRCFEDVKKIKFDLIICDEAHRLKNKSIKTSSMIAGLKTRRRVLLTGTPIQNDLKEFHALVDICNPGVLGTSSSFRRIYEEPIVRGQQPDASSEENVLGQTRAAELNRLTSLFFLRRTADINSRYLPAKVESVVFCRPSALQLSLYRHLLSSTLLRSCLSASHVGGARHLMCISALKKLCNDPSLVHSAGRKAADLEEEPYMDENSLYEGLYGLYPDGFDPNRFTTEHSGKLIVLSRMLTYIRGSSERVVLVSNYTQTLDLLQKLCEANEYRFLRLDGSTPTTKRQSLVDRFNSAHCKDFVFLLSSKAGGVGLNLIGASRLILYDIDWNPANDLQAMARVWRDGQKKDVYVYRLLTTGTIEEKIYQRQTAKQGLSGAVADAKDNMRAEFSREDLKELFTLHELSMCDTHDLLSCPCLTQQNEDNKDSDKESVPPTDHARSCLSGGTQKNLSIAELMEWQHFASPVSESDLEDDAVKSGGSFVSFVFRSESNGSGN